MAITKILLTKHLINEAVEMPALTAVSAAKDGGLVDFTEMDTKTLVIVKNAGVAVAEIIIEKGDGFASVEDMSFSLGAGKTFCFTLESGKFKKLYGENRGCLLIKATDGATIQLGAIVLP